MCCVLVFLGYVVLLASFSSELVYVYFGLLDSMHSFMQRPVAGKNHCGQVEIGLLKPLILSVIP